MPDTASVASDPGFPTAAPSRTTFGPVEDADSTRQAQHMEANDAPVDINLNAVVGRSQTLTFDALGKSFVSNEDLRQKYADLAFARFSKT